MSEKQKKESKNNTKSNCQTDNTSKPIGETTSKPISPEFRYNDGMIGFTPEEKEKYIKNPDPYGDPYGNVRF